MYEEDIRELVGKIVKEDLEKRGFIVKNIATGGGEFLIELKDPDGEEHFVYWG